jgi:acetoin utilization deacetylase AcuC-like enzyme
MTSALSRARARWRLRRHVGVWHHSGYAPGPLERSGDHTGASLRRAERVLARMEAEGLLRPGDVRKPAPASFSDLALAHASSYLEHSTRPEAVGRVFALEPGTFRAEDLVQAQRLAVGATLAAARAVAGGRMRVAVNLGGGFHHAAPDRGGGFCLFNDVVTAVERLRADGLATRVAVVDLDFHQGDGTMAALGSDGDVLQYSIHGAVWSHDDAGGWQIAMPPGTGDGAYLDMLRRTLPGALRRHRPDVVFFLAGTDVLGGDPLGAFALTPRGVLERDRFVVRSARQVGAGLVILMAGGYQEDAWAPTANLLRWLLGASARVEVPGHADRRRRLDAIAESLEHAMVLDDGALTEADVLGDLGIAPAAPRFLDLYSPQGLEYALERCGVLERLRERGFGDLRIAVDGSDRDVQVGRIRGRYRGQGPSVVLAELRAARRRLAWPVAGTTEPPLDMLEVGWLLLQDPSASFTLERPPLPGQAHPGLGVAREVEALLVVACERLGLDGVLMRPAHLHVASGAAPEFRFLDPEAEGRLRALEAALAAHGTAEASRLMDAGDLVDAAGRPLSWQPGPQVLPVSPRLRAYLESASYREARDAAVARLVGGELRAASVRDAAAAG